MKDHADYLTEEELRAQVEKLCEEVKSGVRDEFELERDAYFTDPANAEEIAAMFARIELVKEMYKARREAGLTQKEIAKRMGTNQTYIAALERGRKNITFSTLAKYARACGKKVALLSRSTSDGAFFRHYS